MWRLHLLADFQLEAARLRFICRKMTGYANSLAFVIDELRGENGRRLARTSVSNEKMEVSMRSIPPEFDGGTVRLYTKAEIRNRTPNWDFGHAESDSHCHPSE